MSTPATDGSNPAWVARCRACGKESAPEALRWQCDCAGLLDVHGPVVDPTPPPGAPWSLWRYRDALPPASWPGQERVTLGEGMTPLIEGGDGCLCKLDFLMPTLSFKDRGASVLMAAVSSQGFPAVVVDSSGNAGTAVAAYAARAGVAAEIFVPERTSPSKVAAMRRYGALVRLVPGTRRETTLAAQHRVAETGFCYAGHAHQPLFVHGVKTVAFELWEQLGGRAPAAVVVPAGNGTLLLGVALGFSDLARAGLIDHAPRLVAVQAARCAALLGRAQTGRSIAEGIAIADPPRGPRMLAAIAASGGTVVAVEDHSIVEARADLAARGIDVEPSAAAAWAGWQLWSQRARSGAPVVVVLCGAGLKTG